MALQGDLKSFALPDVLRLIAGAGKSGHLEVAGTGGSGAVLLRKGSISSAAVSTAPRADDPADVLFELLRFEDGSFTFDEGQVDDKGLGADVESTIVEAEALVGEWVEIEAVVPSMEAWISLAPEVEADEITVTARAWRALAAIGGGGNVHDLADALGLSDLEASRQVVELVELDLVSVRPTHGYQPPRVELDGLDDYDGDLVDPISGFEDLIAEDRPVVMEDRDDALLPEPLPGEGVAYEAETITGVVDGRTFDAFDSHPEAESTGALEPIEPAEPYQQFEQFEQFEQFDSLASFEAAAAMSERAGEPGTTDRFGDADPFAPADPVGSDAAISSDYLVPDATGPASELAEAVAGEDGSVDDERDSLLKFLSSVKP